MTKLLTALTILVSLQVLASDLEPRKLRKKIDESPAFKTWNNAVFAEYTPENETNSNSNIYYYGDFNYQPSYAHRFRWFQRISHQIIPETNKQNGGEVAILNPRMQYFYNFQEPLDKSYHLALRMGAELGTSLAAQDDGIQAIPNFRLEFDKRFGFMTASLRPFVSYWVTQYSTNKIGEPFPMFVVGHNLYVTVPITGKFTWNFELETAFQMFQPADVRAAQGFNSNPSADPLETSKTALFVGTEIGYMFTKKFQTRLGYYQFDKFMSDGKYALELLNNNTTRFFIGLDYIF